MNFTYDTDRLILRILDGRFAEDILNFYLENQEDFEQYEPKRAEGFYTYDFHKSILELEYNMSLRGDLFRFYVYKKHNPNKIIGTVSVRNVTRGSYHKCEIGYKMDRRYRQQGYGKEAIKKACEVAFSVLDLHRIEAVCLPWNEPSIKLLEDIGFEYEGKLRKYCEINGVYEDHLLFSLINE